MNKRFGIGIVGLQPGRSWAARAHIPALRALSDDFEIIGVANTSLASAQAAAASCGIPRAFGNVAEMVASPEIDIVSVTVKVPHHFEIVKMAIAARKHVYCEWPLGNGLAEAEQLTELAHAQGVLGVVGTQARVAPEIEHLRQLIAGGYVGNVLSTTLVARGGSWGRTIPEATRRAYVLDRANGATMLTIPFGHTLAALQDVLGNVVELSATLTTRQTSVLVISTGETVPQTAPDQIIVSGLLEGGAPISIHYRGGEARGGTPGLLWDINGSEGDIQVSGGPSGNAQILKLSLKGARGDAAALLPLDVPALYYEGWPEDAVSGNVARVYARMASDLRDGTHTAPTFNDCLALHRLIETVEAAADYGMRIHVPTEPEVQLGRYCSGKTLSPYSANSAL